MLAMTKRTEYALIALHYMIEEGAIAQAGLSPNPASAREIAVRYNMPLPLLMNILKKLTGSGVLLSLRGVKGGYLLASDPRKLSVANLIEAVEGPIAIVDCACEHEDRAADAVDSILEQGNGHGHGCKLESGCPVRLPLQKLNDRLLDFLRSTSVHDVCAGGENGSFTQVGVTAGALS